MLCLRAKRQRRGSAWSIECPLLVSRSPRSSWMRVRSNRTACSTSLLGRSTIVEFPGSLTSQRPVLVRLFYIRCRWFSCVSCPVLAGYDANRRSCDIWRTVSWNLMYGPVLCCAVPAVLSNYGYGTCNSRRSETVPSPSSNIGWERRGEAYC